MALLDRIRKPSDLRTLTAGELRSLAQEIRQFLVTNVARTGGHLGPNLGVVELTMAIHLVFDSPKDPIVFDVGHQSYVHKILTGRADGFDRLRQKGGLSGYPNRGESEHDWFENSHASAGLSWSEGMARAFALTGQRDRTVVTVVGDGALTGGMAWEALNNIADEPELPMVIVVNDNGRSYSPTVGGLSRQLSGLRTDPRYERAMESLKANVSHTPLVGRPAYDLLHGLKIGLKDVLAPQGLFSDLGLKYIGPIDGHDLEALTVAMRQAKGFGGPVIVHAITRKGKGFVPAENHERDRFHAIGRIDECTGEPLTPSVEATWTDAFGAELVALGAERLVMLTDVAGLYSDWPASEDVITQISASELQELLPGLVSGMRPKMEACLRAVQGGVSRATVIDGRVEHSLLLEIFTNDGIGTMVRAEEDEEL